ncbi:MAG TPA: MASE1 domain-containing protein [Anaeromyxobacteraceae bacterium]|nr:MASE1 domain-containing protein [Anaeromyxobacteraceae bacterium]
MRPTRGSAAAPPDQTEGPDGGPAESPPPLAPWARALRLPPWAAYPLLAAGYFLFARLGYLLLDPDTRIAVWWPPSGLYLAALLLLPRRRWPLAVAAILPAAVIGSLLRGRTPSLALWFFSGNTLEAVAGAWLVLRLGGPRPSPSTVRGALALATLPALAAGAILVAGRGAQALLLDGSFSRSLWMFWGGSSLGAVLAAPLVLAWIEPSDRRRRPGFAAEAVAVGASLLLAVGLLANRAGTPWAHEVVLVPPLLWSAIRFGPRGATLGLAATAVAACWLNAGPASAGAHAGIPMSLPALQFFLAALVVTVLLVAAAWEERSRTARDLARSRDLLGSFFASVPTGVFVKDEHHRAVVLSSHFTDMLGVPLGPMLGRTVAETLPSPLGEELLALERSAVENARAVQREIRLGDRTFLDLAFPIPRAEGPPYVGGLALEVTDRVRAEERLRESERRLRLVEGAIDQASDAVNVLEADGRIVWLNAAHARMLGQPKERLVGRSLLEVVPEIDPEDFRRRWDEVVRRGVLVSEHPIRAPDGRPVPGEIASAAVEFAGRRYLVSSVRDVSDRRRAEAADRLAGIGTLAAGVAHEINNPLAYVLTNLAWLREQLVAGSLPPPGELRRVIEEAHDGAAQVRAIVQHLRLFARPDETVGPIDVRASARSALTLAQNEIRHRAALVVRLPDVPRVLGNENRLAQVFLNLLGNAAQAIPAGRADQNQIRLEVSSPDGRTVVAEVADTGGGIPEEARAHLFEPFFTTKPVGAGMGLGLFVCQGIVTGMGGRIEVDSRVGAGTTFRLVLPAAPEVGPSSEQPAAPLHAPARRGRILVVDDDERVAVALRRILQRDHDVDIHTDAHAALERVRAGETWDLVFCDLMMPRMTGMEWFEEARRTSPALAARIVFVTGGAFTDAAREFLERVPNGRLDKPFTPDEVRAVVAERLPPPAA